jgi:hypothetical protein
MGKIAAATIFSNVKLDNVEVLKSAYGYELWCQKMSLNIDVMGIYKIVILDIDASPTPSAEKFITV